MLVTLCCQKLNLDEDEDGDNEDADADDEDEDEDEDENKHKIVFSSQKGSYPKNVTNKVLLCLIYKGELKVI